MSIPVDLRARSTLPDAATLARHDRAVWDLRTRRDTAVAALGDFESLRVQAEAIKAHTLDHLDQYLEGFERQARAAGASVHWAENAEGHNRIVHQLLDRNGVRQVVKSKSMLTEDCGLNPYLEARGIEIIDTDLGERIVQLGGEGPSHMVIPAVHRTRDEIGALFHRTLGTPPGERDPARLVALARAHLRPRFLEAGAGITGVNFAVARTGSLVVCTNEGNADLGMSVPPLHIACMGIEKVIPDLDDLAVFLRLLARSATGQPITAYTSLVTGPRPGGELHIVIVDDGRSRLLADLLHRQGLGCIRCGACLNTCPVYRRAGGHAYAQAVSGPIGSVLGPALYPHNDVSMLPLASTLCGSCAAVCPVRIDLDEQLLRWREEARTRKNAWMLRGMSALASHPRLYRAGLRGLRFLWPGFARRWPGNPFRSWLRGRELPRHPGASFAQLYKRERRRGR